MGECERSHPPSPPPSSSAATAVLESLACGPRVKGAAGMEDEAARKGAPSRRVRHRYEPLKKKRPNGSQSVNEAIIRVKTPWATGLN